MSSHVAHKVCRCGARALRSLGDGSEASFPISHHVSQSGSRALLSDTRFRRAADRAIVDRLQEGFGKGPNNGNGFGYKCRSVVVVCGVGVVMCSRVQGTRPLRWYARGISRSAP
jgi:hypothetical protein